MCTKTVEAEDTTGSSSDALRRAMGLRCFPGLPRAGAGAGQTHGRKVTCRAQRQSLDILTPSLEGKSMGYSVLFCCLLGHFSNHSGNYWCESPAGRAASSFIGITCITHGLAQATSAFVSVTLRLAESLLLRDRALESQEVAGVCLESWVAAFPSMARVVHTRGCAGSCPPDAALSFHLCSGSCHCCYSFGFTST